MCTGACLLRTTGGKGNTPPRTHSEDFARGSEDIRAIFFCWQIYNPYQCTQRKGLSQQMTHSVLVYVFANGAQPRRMSIAHHGGDIYRLHFMESVFPMDTVVYSTNIRIGACRFILYFDKTRHDTDRENAVYMFVRVASSGRPVDVCPEDDTPAMIEALTLLDSQW